jgi:hypothetical protein
MLQGVVDPGSNFEVRFCVVLHCGAQENYVNQMGSIFRGITFGSPPTYRWIQAVTVLVP